MTKFKSVTEVRNTLGRIYKVELPPVAMDKFTPYQVMYRKGWVLMSSSNVVAAYIYEDGHYYVLKDAWTKPEILVLIPLESGKFLNESADFKAADGLS